MWVKPLRSENIQGDTQMTQSSQHWSRCQSQCHFEMVEGPGNSEAGRLEGQWPRLVKEKGNNIELLHKWQISSVMRVSSLCVFAEKSKIILIQYSGCNTSTEIALSIFTFVLAYVIFCLKVLLCKIWCKVNNLSGIFEMTNQQLRFEITQKYETLEMNRSCRCLDLN